MEYTCFIVTKKDKKNVMNEYSVVAETREKAIKKSEKIAKENQGFLVSVSQKSS